MSNRTLLLGETPTVDQLVCVRFSKGLVELEPNVDFKALLGIHPFEDQLLICLLYSFWFL